MPLLISKTKPFLPASLVKQVALSPFSEAQNVSIGLLHLDLESRGRKQYILSGCSVLILALHGKYCHFITCVFCLAVFDCLA